MPYKLDPTDPHSFAQYDSDGLNISCRDLETKDCCQFQYVVAWAKASDDVASWIAVDRDYGDLLHRFNA